MPIPTGQHFYFKSAGNRYRIHVGCKGSIVMASCQGVARLKMDVQRLMVERKHFGLKFHLLANSREMVDLILFTNRAEVKEVHIRVDGKDVPAVTEKVYRDAEASGPAADVGAATLVEPPPGMGLAADLSPPASLPSPEQDDVLDRLAILTGSGQHPAVDRSSGAVTALGSSTPSKGIRIDFGSDIVPPVSNENDSTPALELPAVPPIPKPSLPPVSKPTAAPAKSGQRPGQRSGVAPAARSNKQPGVSPAVSPPATPSPDTAVKPNKNAVAPEGELQVPDGLDDLLAAADEIKKAKNAKTEPDVKGGGDTEKK